MNSFVSWARLVPISNSRYCWLALPFAILSIAGSAVAGVASHYFELYLFAMVYWAYQYQVIQLRKAPELVFVPNLFREHVNVLFGQLYLLILAKFLVTWYVVGLGSALLVSSILLVCHLAVAWGAVKSNFAAQWPFYALLPLLIFEIDLTSVLPWHNLMVIPVLFVCWLTHRHIGALHRQRFGPVNDIDHYEWRWLPALSNHNVILLNPLLRYALWGKHAAIAGVIILMFIAGAVSALIPLIQAHGWTTAEAWIATGTFSLVACAAMPHQPEQLSKLWQFVAKTRAQIAEQLALTFILLQLIAPLTAMVAWLILGHRDLQMGVVQSFAAAIVSTCLMFGFALVPHKPGWWQPLVKLTIALFTLASLAILMSVSNSWTWIITLVGLPAALWLHARWHDRIVSVTSNTPNTATAKRLFMGLFNFLYVLGVGILVLTTFYYAIRFLSQPELFTAGMTLIMLWNAIWLIQDIWAKPEHIKPWFNKLHTGLGTVGLLLISPTVLATVWQWINSLFG